METAIDQDISRPRDQAAARSAGGGFNIGRWIIVAILAALTVTWVVPFIWMISTSLKAPQEWFGGTWIPRNPAWENYTNAFSFGMWGSWAMNTVIITVISVIGHVLSVSMIAYGFGRLRFPFRDQLFSIVLATMMLPGVVTMIPTYILFSKLPAFGIQGSDVWLNTFLPLTVPAFTGGAFYIFLMRQFMRGIPMELSEAAKIDGAGEMRIWWSIVTPLTKPALAFVGITTFQGAWEDFVGPLLYLKTESLYTLQLGLRTFEFAAGGAPHWGQLMAASLVVMMPIVIVFVFFQRYFIEGVSLTGLAGR